jgi:hypothetical protein
MQSSREIGKQIAQERRNQAEARRHAVGTLDPKQMRKALLKGQIDPFEAVLWGTGADGSPFTLQDIQKFGSARKRVEKTFKPTQGAPAIKLMAASLYDDIMRSNSEIRGGGLHQITGAVLHFNIPSSGNTRGAPPFYGVRIRLDEWNSNLTSYADYKDAVKASVKGNVSIDCTCGRYQYYFRYVATAANVAMKPFEKDFPKITNPKLQGMCCKHQLRALKLMGTPTYSKLLEKQMEKQAGGVGFLGDAKAAPLSKKDMAALKKARPSALNHDRLQKSLKAFEATQKAYKNKTSGNKRDTEYVKAMEAEKRKLKAMLTKAKNDNKKQQEKIKELVRGRKVAPTSSLGDSALKAKLRTEIATAKRYNSSRDDAIQFFATDNKISLAKALALSKSIK